MSEDMERVESPYERKLRLDEQRDTERHEMTKIEFAENMEWRKVVTEQAKAVTNQAQHIAELARETVRVSKVQADAVRGDIGRAEARAEEPYFVEIDGSYIALRSILAIQRRTDQSCLVFMPEGVAIEVSMSAPNAAAAVYAALRMNKQ